MADTSPSEPRATRDLPPPLPAINPLLATLLSLGAGLLVAIREIDGLVSQVFDPATATTWSVTTMTSPFGDRAGWGFLAAQKGADPGSSGEMMQTWLQWYVALDVALIAVYTALLLWWAVRLRQTAVDTRPLTIAIVAISIGAVADFVEGLMIWHLSGASHPVPAVSIIKWVALLLGLAICTFKGRAVVLRGLRLLPGALYTQRYSLLIVLPLAVLGIGSGPDLLEQVPDIQRHWVDGKGGDILAAVIVTLVLCVAAFVTGRQRTHHLWRRTLEELPAETDPRSPLLLWFVGPALILVGATVAWTNGGEVAVWRMVLFASVPTLVAVISWYRRRDLATSKRPRRGKVNSAQFRAASLVGDLLPGLLLVVAGLGAVRSFTAVIALDQGSTGTILLYVFGWAALVHTWFLEALICHGLARAGSRASTSNPTRRERLVRLLTPGLTPESAESDDDSPSVASLKRSWLSWAVLGASIVLAIGVAVAPEAAADLLGVIGTFQLALGCLCLMIASAVIIMQPSGAPEAFWKLGFGFTPTTSLVVAACLVAALADSTDVHPVRTLPDDELGPSDRPDVRSLLTDWLATDPNGDCTVPLRNKDVGVRPLLLFAAEGGGIRAAYWTAAGIDTIGAAVEATGAPAACHHAFLSSGASGGAVGLSIASVAASGEASDETQRIAGADALAQATNGLLLRDTVFGATGVSLPAYGGQDRGAHEWVDRAGLIEESWEASVDELADPWIRDHSGWDWGPPGPLVLNSTSSTTGCRALVSQVDLGVLDISGCRSSESVAASTDVLACTKQIRVSTAALLASRFPFITPAAAVQCGDGINQQLVDGGYTENTGIGTLLDIAPQIMSWVRRHNSCVLSGGGTACEGGKTPTLVVPTLVYFDNGSGTDLVAKPPEPRLELLVPLLTKLRSTATLYSSDSQLQRAVSTFGPSQLWGQARPRLVRAIRKWREGPVYVVFQPTDPGITAPLGWVLSDASRRSMDRALEQRTSPGFLEYGSLRTLIDDLRPGVP